MCGIAGLIRVGGGPVVDMDVRLGVMSKLIAHRGPNGDGIWSPRAAMPASPTGD